MRNLVDLAPSREFSLLACLELIGLLSCVWLGFSLSGEPKGPLASFAEKLEWIEANKSDNVIRASITQGQSDTAKYYTRQGFGPIFAPPGFGPPLSGPSDDVTFTPWTHNLAVLDGGKKVFNTTMTATAPHVLQEAKGETAQQTVNRICQPNPDFFTNASIPPYILNAQFQDSVGKSNVTAEGLK